MSNGGIDRREFLKGAAAAAVMVFAADELFAAEAAKDAPVTGPAVKIGVIGLGQWGKEIVTTLSKLPSAQVTAICDTYDSYVKRAAKSVTGAAEFSDYRKLLESPDVEAVIIATPTHQHKEIALAAVQAGKHVYCEAPLAVTVEDAKAIAMAGQASKSVFQVGLQGRSNRLYTHIEQFVKAGNLGNTAQCYAQYNKKQNWARVAPSPEREAEINWRLHKATSCGLVGELGLHWIDLANWYLGGLPTAVTGFGSIINWKDGRDVPDTAQCVLEYPKDVKVVFMSTLASSFSGDYMILQGSDGSLALREDVGWMVREADSPLLGWEVYARKEKCFDETGICMVADATKILKAGGEPGKDAEGRPKKQALECALEDFTRSIREGAKVASGAAEGYRATVAALKANEAIVSGSRVTCPAELFELK
jgi:predicted dehydrogenase